MSNGTIICLMALSFLFFGYLGVPVAFALIGGVLIATAFTDVSFPSIIDQLFVGIDSIPLLAVPFFLLAGELMTSANVTEKMIRFAQCFVGHMRGGLAQVISVFSMFFAGISGSSTADVAAISKVIIPEMKKEGYDLAFSAALIAAASTMANLIPPSIMAVVYGATGNVSIAGLFLGGVAPGLMIGFGLMIYSYFFGPVGIKKQRATFVEISQAAKEAAIPLMIPIIIMGGILTGLFTPTEAGMAAVIYILLIAIPLMNRRHIKELPRDFINAGVLYSIPMMAVAGASAFGWMIAYLQGPKVVSAWIQEIVGPNPSPVLILFLIVGIFIIVGDFMDAIPAIIIFMPILTELAQLANINPVHMGVVVIVTLAFGLLTPPYGLSLLLASGLAGVRFSRALLACLPLYVVFFTTIAICVFFPELVLWLPKTLLPETVGCFKGPDGNYICP